jgi:hypothetical protein
MVHADDVNMLGGEIDITRNRKDTLIDVNEEFGVDVNAEETRYSCMLLFRHQTVEQNYDIKTASRSFKTASVV